MDLVVDGLATGQMVCFLTVVDAQRWECPELESVLLRKRRRQFSRLVDPELAAVPLRRTAGYRRGVVASSSSRGHLRTLRSGGRRSAAQLAAEPPIRLQQGVAGP